MKRKQFSSSIQMVNELSNGKGKALQNASINMSTIITKTKKYI